ncbi:integrase core domain-containing protein, partial [Paracoccus indicus]|uniref:integrase core domain-containing protein n=1 Tax=Paracoccus indicus TaxID=2079229 RepID=UPI001B8D9003
WKRAGRLPHPKAPLPARLPGNHPPTTNLKPADPRYDRGTKGGQVRGDNGTEFVPRDLVLWAYAKGATLDFSRPGKPKDNGFIEVFNSKLRSECLNAHWFMSPSDAGEKLEDWRRHYNDDRPHSAIGYNVPSVLHFLGDATSPSS